jgi:hypothetical protein
MGMLIAAASSAGTELSASFVCVCVCVCAVDECTNFAALCDQLRMQNLFFSLSLFLEEVVSFFGLELEGKKYRT